eukprot:jgi/Chrzof1/400/Cz01g14140.t1
MAKMKRSYSDVEAPHDEEQYANQFFKAARQQMSSSASPKMKACAQCGTTRTPQWREGPLGPKTLCNACGVKRVRAMKAMQEGRKPASPIIKRSPGPPAPTRTESSDLAAALQLLSSRTETSGRRPIRQAAIRAIKRAVEFELEELPTGTRGSLESNQTDSGEEISWSPHEEEDLNALEADAAANLLSMSCAQPVYHTPAEPEPQSQHHSQQQQQQQQQQPHQQPVVQVPRRPRTTPKLVVKEEDVMHLLGAGMPVLADMLPSQQLLELMKLREMVDNAHREAAAADAAVAAVAKILAIKQDAAEHAHTVAVSASKQLYGLVAQLDAEFGFSQTVFLQDDSVRPTAPGTPPTGRLALLTSAVEAAL